MTPELSDVTGDLDPEVMVIFGILLQRGADGARVLAAPIAAQVNAPPEAVSCKALGGELSKILIAAEVHGVAIVGDASEWLARALYFNRLVSNLTTSSDITVVF
jgi:hypothetical protein